MAQSNEAPDCWAQELGRDLVQAMAPSNKVPETPPLSELREAELAVDEVTGFVTDQAEFEASLPSTPPYIPATIHPKAAPATGEQVKEDSDVAPEAQVPLVMRSKHQTS